MQINQHQYLYIYADCIAVKGHTRTLIHDLSRRQMYFIDNSYYPILGVFREHPIGDIMQMIEEDDQTEFEKFIAYILNNNLGTLVDDIKLFPPLSTEWDHPSTVTNAIVDIRDEFHDFEKIFSELEELGCYYLQIRAYKTLSIAEIEEILSLAKNTSLCSIQILTKFDGQHSYLESLTHIYKQDAIVFFVVYDIQEVELAALQEVYYHPKHFMLTSQAIHSRETCGIINEATLQITDHQVFMENIKFNGCLNRKISIDEKGLIKNCPSMVKDYGHINENSLEQVIDNEDFSRLWSINKDEIDTCKVCEFRYICTDCRAYIEDPDDIYSKPKKCGYNPYEGKWEGLNISESTI